MKLVNKNGVHCIDCEYIIKSGREYRCSFPLNWFFGVSERVHSCREAVEICEYEGDLYID